MSHLLWGRNAAPPPLAPDAVPEIPPTAVPPVPATEQHPLLSPGAVPGADSQRPHPHHLTETIAAAWHHIPHSLPEPHQHYPRRDSYLEAARLSREMKHL